MSELFLNILNMSISASWIVFAVLILRFLLKKSPKWITVLLWGIVGIRLICPFSFESVMSLIPSAQTVNPSLLISEPEINTGFETVDNIVNPVISEAVTSVEPEKAVNIFKLSVSIFSKLWLIGIAVMLIYALVSYFRLRKKVDTAVRLKDNIYQSEVVVSPFVLGIIKPKIYLPFNMNERDAELVIAHEKAHLMRRDHLWKLLGFLILAVYWFNPILWLGYILLCRDIEFACDEKVIKELDIEKRTDYSETLLNCAASRRMISACPLAFGEVSIKQRIKGVLNYKKPTFWFVLAAVVALIAASVCLLTNPLKSQAIPSAFEKVLYEQHFALDEAYYCILDIDGDNKDEMITVNNCMITVYVLEKDKAVAIGSQDFETATWKLLNCQKKNRYGLVAVTTGSGQNWYKHLTIKDGEFNLTDMFEDDFSGINNYQMTKHISDEQFIKDAKEAYDSEKWLNFKQYENNVKLEISKDAEKLLEVLYNEAQFITGKGETVYLKDYKPFFSYVGGEIEKDYQFVPSKYTVVDMDRDGKDELIAYGAEDNYDYLILRSKDGKIYGYSMENRCFQALKQDGSFRDYSGSFASTYKTMSFDKEKRFDNAIAEYIVYTNGDDYINESTINGKSVSLEKIQKFKDEWEKRPNAKWVKFVDKDKNENIDSEEKSSLLMRLTGFDNTDSIEKLEIMCEYTSLPCEITNKNDYVFLENYVYSYNYSSDKIHELYTFPKTSRINVTISGETKALYLLENGDIAFQIIKNNIALSAFEVYTAKNSFLLNKDALIILLKKYGGYNEVLAESYKTYPEYSVNDNVCIKDSKGRILLNSGCFDTVQVRNEDNQPSVLLTLTDEGKDLFATVTAEHIGKTLDLCAGDEVISSPTVVGKITDGKVSIATDSVKKAETIVNKMKN